MVIETNVNGPFLMARAALPHLLRAGWGRIINISMNHETMRRRGFSPYGPSKAALESATAIWAQDLAGSGITANTLLPGGATATGMIPAGLPEEVLSQLLAPEVVVPPLLWRSRPLPTPSTAVGSMPAAGTRARPTRHWTMRAGCAADPAGNSAIGCWRPLGAAEGKSVALVVKQWDAHHARTAFVGLLP
ncbi:MAG: SDR family oxidoreductase [Variovorax sp.]